MERVGREEKLGRDLYLLDVSRAEEVALRLKAPSSRFVALVMWDAVAAPVAEVSRVVEALMSAGCVYICAWGSDCERVHDIADEVEVMKTLDDANARSMMTTWHDHDSLDDVLVFFLAYTQPSDDFPEGCNASVAVCINQDRDRIERVRFAMRNAALFLAENDG